MDKDGVTKKEVLGIEHVFDGEMVRPIYTLTVFTQQKPVYTDAEQISKLLLPEIHF